MTAVLSSLTGIPAALDYEQVPETTYERKRTTESSFNLFD